MDQFKEFLESSTIGGLSYISTTRRTSKIFWIIVVLTTFTISFVEIWNLFQDWEKNPIKTTTETLPIYQLTLPNITVCPPKNSFLNLNYDIVVSEKVKVDNETRQGFLEYAIKVVQDDYHTELMRNLSKLDDPKRFYNWYRGYSFVHYPFFNEKRLEHSTLQENNAVTSSIIDNQLAYEIFTSATSGNISTKHFDEDFDEEKIERDLYVRVFVLPPPSVKGNVNATLILEIKKISLQDEENPQNAEMWINDHYAIANNLNNWSLNVSGSHMTQYKDKDDFGYSVRINRKLSENDILNNKQKKMPGFRFLWNYNKNVEPWFKYRKDFNTKQFVR